MQDQDKTPLSTAENQLRYEAPAIIFEGLISTRAGSPVIEGDAPQPPDQEEGIDLFPQD